MRRGGAYLYTPWISSLGAGAWPSDAGLRAVRELQEILHVAAPKLAWPKIIRYAVFAVESQVCSRHLMWPEQRDVLRRSMQAELNRPEGSLPSAWIPCLHAPRPICPL